MKTLLKFSVLVMILTIFTAASCEKPSIPEGDDTFSCYINGKLFVPKGCSTCVPYNNGLNFILTNYDQDLIIRGSSNNKIIFIYLKNYFDENSFTTNQSNGNLNYPYNTPETSAIVIINDEKYLSNNNSGNVIFTIKTESDIKGTFEFTLYNENNPNDKIYVTNGRFDN